LKSDFLNPFVESAVSVLHQFIDDIQINRGELTIKEEPTKTMGVMIYIGISGDLEGRVVYNMPLRTCVELAEVMNGEHFPGMNDMVRSTIQELCNVISGNAGSQLEKNVDNKTIDITPPSMISGNDAQITDSISEKFIIVPLETNYGAIEINLSVRESS
jgi:chemotaxis protein CheX